MLTMINFLLLVLSLLGIINSQYVYDTRWYNNMPLDHFGYTNADTFNLRYMVNDTWWRSGGPIFFYCGNEGAIEMFLQNTGFVWDIAPEYNALVVFAEHRYYGKSLPFGNQSYTDNANRGYLSSEQALADYAVLIHHLKSNMNGAVNSPVVAFGGSYGGMLAAWFRMKYPSVVVGSLASSAPILQFAGITDCGVFTDIVTRTFGKDNANCPKVIKQSWSAIDNLLRTQSGTDFLNKQFNFCSDSKLSGYNDKDQVYQWLNDAWSYMAMIDYPYPNSFLMPVPGWPVKEGCSFMTDPSATDENIIKQLVTGLKVYLNYTGESQCYELGSTTTSDLSDSGWYYQTCTEMYMPVCQRSSSMFYETMWNYESFAQDCKKVWDTVPRPQWVLTNYGGVNLAASSNIIFSNGELDPWSGGGVTINTNLAGADSSLVRLNLKMGAHHYDLRGADPRDTEEVKAIRETEKAYISCWIKSNGSRCTKDVVFPVITTTPESIAGTDKVVLSGVMLVCAMLFHTSY